MGWDRNWILNALTCVKFLGNSGPLLNLSYPTYLDPNTKEAQTLWGTVQKLTKILPSCVQTFGLRGLLLSEQRPHLLSSRWSSSMDRPNLPVKLSHHHLRAEHCRCLLFFCLTEIFTRFWLAKIFTRWHSPPRSSSKIFTRWHPAPPCPHPPHTVPLHQLFQPVHLQDSPLKCFNQSPLILPNGIKSDAFPMLTLMHGYIRQLTAHSLLR